MKKFVYIYTGGSAPTSPEEGKKVMDAWMAYFAKLGDKVVDAGSPFGPGTVVGTHPASGVTGYTIISAASMEDAVALTNEHPHMTFGGFVEVFEVLPM